MRAQGTARAQASRRRGVACAAVALGVCATAGEARAQGAARALLGVDLEAGGSVLVDRENSALYGAGASAALDLEVNAHPLLGVHGGVVGACFLAGSDGTAATAYGARLGLRVHVGAVSRTFAHDVWVDAHATYLASAGIARPGFDAGLGLGIRATRGLRVGPFARANWSHDPLGMHPLWLSAGLSVELLGDPRHAEGDADGDGVLDGDDVCPAEPAGAHPDARRRGCAARDTDGDAVFDADDACPTLPAGAHPDATRRGCPGTDRDGDGVHDADDRCPNEAGAAPTGCPPHDADADGVVDERDACPTTAAGAHPDPDRAGCPDGDDDADGVVNHADACRAEPAGLHPDAARPGCPMPDRDRDNIPDATDACPDQPGAASRDARRNGCPGLLVIEQGQIRILRPVFFAPRQDRILPRSAPVLRAIADALLATPEITRLSIEGHTDDVGDDAVNLDLSRRRAANVMARLVVQGVEPARLRSEGFGETRPIVNLQTPDARAANRRVEFRIEAVRGVEPGARQGVQRATE